MEAGDYPVSQVPQGNWSIAEVDSQGPCRVPHIALYQPYNEGTGGD